MSDDAESCGAVCLHESVGHRPAIKTYTKAVISKYAVHLCKGWPQPFIVIVIRDGAPIAGLVTGDIRRVGKDEVNAFVLEHRKGLKAVGIKDGVAKNGHRLVSFS